MISTSYFCLPLTSIGGRGSQILPRMVDAWFQQGNMKHKMDFHKNWKLELKNHDINLFQNEEWT
jgi:hypothetical protein